MAEFRTPIARARGLGAAKAGPHHWWHQRLTAVANILLMIWFTVSVIMLAGANYTTVVWWVRDPLISVLLVAFIANLFYHLWLGLRVPIEDYVHTPGTKLIAVVALTFGCVVIALLGILSVLKISFGG